MPFNLTAAPARVAFFRLSALCLGAALAGLGLSACVPVAVVGGAVGAGAVLITGDRRSNETQNADHQIDALGRDQVTYALDGRGHVNLSSYYRKVLLTGEVPTEQDRQRIEAIARGLPEVQGVINELAVMPASGPLDRSNDALITSKVRARLVNQNGVPSGAIKVVTERGVTYLMGRLTRAEVALVTDTASQTDGVQRVVRVIDLIAESPGGAGGVITFVDGAPVTSQGAPLNATQPVPAVVGTPIGSQAGQAGQAITRQAEGVVTQPVLQSPIVQKPGSVPIQVQTLPPVK